MLNFFIVVPTRNSSEFLEETLSSVLSQNIEQHNVHLHVQDSLSEDATLDIIRAYSTLLEVDPRRNQLKMTYASEFDNGMYDAINKGLSCWATKFNTPDIFFWLNSDDILLPSAIKNIAETFKAGDVEWIIGRSVDIDEQGEVIFDENHPNISLSDLRTGEFNFTGGVWLRAESTAVRYSTMRKLDGFKPNLKLAGDFDLFIRLARRISPVYCNYSLRAFRRHQNQLSKLAIQYQHERSFVRYFLSPIDQSESLLHPKDFLKGREIVYYPDYTSGNSYQTLLCSGVPSIGVKTLEELRVLCDKDGGKLIFHINWLNQITQLEHSAAVASSQDFENAIKIAKKHGHKIVFTLHNIASHEGQNIDIEERLVEFLFREANVVHLHHPVVCAEVRARFKTFPWGRVVIGEHGPYPCVEFLQKSDVCSLFGLEDYKKPYFVVPGQIRGYKDVDFLIELVRQLSNRKILSRRLNMFFAGVVHPDVPLPSLEKLQSTPGVYLKGRRLDDTEFSSVIHHAQFALLSYKAISTSGSLFHSLSSGTPVVAPSLGTIPSYLFDGYNGYLYKSGDLPSCINAIESILAGEETKAVDLRANAKQSVAHLNWQVTLARILRGLG